MIRVVRAPERSIALDVIEPAPWIFLAGSIEQGKAEPWQERVEQALQVANFEFGTVFNPRRTDWDPTWSNEDIFGPLGDQINWELEYLTRSAIRFFYFQADTMSPVSMLELGLSLAAPWGRTIVCCPPGFWRRANVLLTCAKHHVQVHGNLSSAIDDLILAVDHLQ